MTTYKDKECEQCCGTGIVFDELVYFGFDIINKPEYCRECDGTGWVVECISDEMEDEDNDES